MTDQRLATGREILPMPDVNPAGLTSWSTGRIWRSTNGCTT